MSEEEKLLIQTEFGKIGLHLTTHPYNKQHALFAYTKEKLVDATYVKWLVGSTSLLESTDQLGNSTTVELSKYPLLEDVGKVEGLTSVVLIPYLIEISKAEAFTWMEIVPSFVDAWKTNQLRKEFEHEQSDR